MACAIENGNAFGNGLKTPLPACLLAPAGLDGTEFNIVGLCFG
jgi:hypothetical protein